MKPLQLPAIFNVATHFVDRHIGEGRAQKIAYECGDERVSYRQLFERVNRAGNALRKLGVRQEERIGLLLLDTPEFPYCFFGAIKIGAVPIPINTMLKPAEYEYILNDSRARVLIVSDTLLPQVLAIAKEKLRYLKTIVVFGKWEGMASLHQLMDESSPALEAEPTSKDDAAFWLYSSGSTGFPKGCVHLHHDMVVCSELYAKNILQITENDRFFSVAKLFFAYGMGNGLYFSLSVGATSILWPRSPAPPYIFSVIEKHRPTLFFSVPSNYSTLLSYKREGGGPEFDLSSVRYAVSAGEALPATIYHRFKERFGVEILDAIGSTENLHMFIANRPGAARPGSSGQIMPGYEARIVDENGHDVPDGEIGSLLIKGDSVCACYWNQHEKTKETIQGHWIRTGDKYYRDPDGYYWYVGRNDDMMKVKGMWVSPVEIEGVLLEHPLVQEAAAIGNPDGNDLVKPAAYIVLKDNTNNTPQLIEEIRQHVLGKLAAFKCPQTFEVVNELPKTATGKIQRYKLRQSAASAFSRPGK